MRNTTFSSIHVAIEKNYDSKFCSNIPLHLVNLIQPHGLLRVLDKTDLRLVQASQNVVAWFGPPAEELLNQPLSAFLPAAEQADFQAKLRHTSSREKIPFSLTFSAGQKKPAGYGAGASQGSLCLSGARRKQKQPGAFLYRLVPANQIPHSPFIAGARHCAPGLKKYSYV